MNRLIASGLAALTCWAVLAPTQARADGNDATVSHVQVEDGTISLLVSVPEGTSVDLDGVGMTVAGKAAAPSASVAGTSADSSVRRTTVLAIDTSDSMKGARFDAAKTAASTYLNAVPADVAVGIVSFDGAVHSVIEPTTDRADAAAAIESLELAHGTYLYDGVLSAVDQLGEEGQRNVLLLSDGRDTSKTAVGDVVAAVKEADVQLDAVALDEKADLAALQSLVTAGHGTLIPADPAALSQTFAAEAAVLTRQLLVTARIPAGVDVEEADVVVSFPAGAQTLTASTYTVLGKPRAASPAVAVRDAASALQLSPTVMYGGLAAIGLGLLVLIGTGMSIATRDRSVRSVEDRIAAYGPSAVASAAAPGARKADTASFNLNQAKDAAASMLHRNKGLEARIEQRLEAGGSALKPAEWLLLHGAIAVIGGMVGLLLGGGSIFLLLAGVAAGLVVPWWYLGFKRKRRVAAFNSGLADTLQLISGSLSAGMSLGQSIDAVVNEGTEPIAGEFKRVLIESRLGVPLEAAMDGVAQRTGSVDFAWVVMAIRIQREVGGNLAELLTTVSNTLRERDYLRRQVKTLSAEGRLSGYLLIGLPIGLFVFLTVTRRDFMEPLFTTTVGYMLMALAIALLGIGSLVMSRLVKLEV